jgi:hypothetical protein
VTAVLIFSFAALRRMLAVGLARLAEVVLLLLSFVVALSARSGLRTIRRRRP